MLEEKDKTLRDELIKERDRITNEIQMRQAKEAQLETEIASLNMAQVILFVCMFTSACLTNMAQVIRLYQVCLLLRVLEKEME